MCLRLLQDYFGGDSEEAKALRKSLVAVYAIGWGMNDEMLERYPHIVPASGELDTGVVVSFECEDSREPRIDGNMIIPKGTKMIAINPFNWKTDDTKADKSLNLGSVVTGADKTTSVIPGFCGAYLDNERGSLMITDFASDFKPNFLKVLKQGSLHLYDYSLPYMNLKKNVADRTEAYIEKNKKPQENLTKISHNFKSVQGISLNMAYTSTISYNGKKHISNFDKLSGSKKPDIIVSIDSALTEYGEAKIKWKNNKNVPTKENKYPRFILYFKAKSATATRDQKRTLKAVNKELKKMPFRFNIIPQNLAYAKNVQITFNSSKTKVKSVTATFPDGSTIKLKKRDFDANINFDGSVTIKGKKNYCGEWTGHP